MTLARFAQDGALATITLERGDAANAMNPALIADLTDAVARVEASSCGAVLLCAEGANFCVGADLKHFATSQTPFPDQLRTMADAFHDMLARLHTLSVPVVAAVQGNAVGAGLGLMMAADVVVMAEDARIATGYARLGLSADAGVSWFLTQALGTRLARSLLMTSRFVGAGEAKTLGLADQVVPAGELPQAAGKQARALADGATAAFAAIKQLTDIPGFRAHLDRERDAIVALATPPEVAAGIAAALKR